MRLHLLLPKVDPKAIAEPSKCPYADCTGKRVQLHQPVNKAVRDTVYQQVEVHRYRCLKCGRTFRVYPPGVTHAQSSERVKGLAVMLYLVGLSYGAVSLALESLGVPLSKTRVYEMVQATAARVPGLKREEVFQGVKTKALGGDLTSVKCAGQWLHLGLTVDSLSGLALTIDEVSAEDARLAFITPAHWLDQNYGRVVKMFLLERAHVHVHHRRVPLGRPGGRHPPALRVGVQEL